MMSHYKVEEGGRQQWIDGMWAPTGGYCITA
jgi:hypothetical protein